MNDQNPFLKSQDKLGSRWRKKAAIPGASVTRLIQFSHKGSINIWQLLVLFKISLLAFTLVHFTHQYLPTYDNMFHYLDMKYFCCLKRTSLLRNTHQRGRCSNEKLMVGRRAAVSSRLLMNVISPNIISHHF